MAAISHAEEDHDNYLYARDELPPEETEENAPAAEKKKKPEEEGSGYEIPDFLKGLDDADIVKID